jgi:hypothetical protein
MPTTGERHLRRLPARLQSTFRPAVWNLAQQPSGGRIRFRTDSTTLGLSARNPKSSNMHRMASAGENGREVCLGWFEESAPLGGGIRARALMVGTRARKLCSDANLLPGHTIGLPPVTSAQPRGSPGCFSGPHSIRREAYRQRVHRRGLNYAGQASSRFLSRSRRRFRAR